MSNTDGALLRRINSISDSALNNINSSVVLLWTISPMIFFAMNKFGVTPYNIHGIMIVILYFLGCVGLIFGVISCSRAFEVTLKKEGKDSTIYKFLPLILLVIFVIWCVFCTIFAKEKRVAIYGYESLRDNLITFLFYLGFVAAGFGTDC